MRARRIPGLQQASSASDDVPDGFYLVRIERLQYRCERRRPYFSIRLSVIEPAAFAGRTLDGRLYSTIRALWKLTWFLRDFGYDPGLLHCEEIDERAAKELTGIVNVSHRIMDGRSLVNFEGFAPASQWEELAPFLPPGATAA